VTIALAPILHVYRFKLTIIEAGANHGSWDILDIFQGAVADLLA
jgi:hypothetical protein